MLNLRTKVGTLSEKRRDLPEEANERNAIFFRCFYHIFNFDRSIQEKYGNSVHKFLMTKLKKYAKLYERLFPAAWPGLTMNHRKGAKHGERGILQKYTGD